MCRAHPTKSMSVNGAALGQMGRNTPYHTHSVTLSSLPVVYLKSVVENVHPFPADKRSSSGPTEIACTGVRDAEGLQGCLRVRQTFRQCVYLEEAISATLTSQPNTTQEDAPDETHSFVPCRMIMRSCEASTCKRTLIPLE